MKKLILFLCVCFFVLGVAPAFAMTTAVWDVTKNTSDINDWIEAQYGLVSVLEDFEGINVGWYPQINKTGVGTFSAEDRSGTGATSYKASDDPYFSIHSSIQDQAPGPYWYGRSNTTTGVGASQWLDSGDITLLTLTLEDPSLTNLFFYIQDPSDCGGKTTMFVNSDAYYTFSGQEDDKASFFVGISLAPGEVLSTLSWSTDSRSDGFGLDDFSTFRNPEPATIHNPEPATMILFGFGLIGIAGLTRRMT